MSATRTAAQAVSACEQIVEHVIGCRVCWLSGTRYCDEAQRQFREWNERYADEGQRRRIGRQLRPPEEAA